MVTELAAEGLRRVCDPKLLGFTHTGELTPIEGIIGQDRALRALQFGLGIRERGFNIYVAGISGTGRTTAVEAFLGQVAQTKPSPPDWCYINNFRDQYRPRALRLPAGQGKKLQREMHNLIEEVRREIPKAFEGEQYATRRESLLETFGKRRDALIAQMNERARSQGFIIQGSPVGLIILPVTTEGQPLSDQEIAQLPAETREELVRRRETLEGELRNTLRQIRTHERETNEELQRLDREVALAAVGAIFNELKETYSELPYVVSYLDDMQNDVLDNIAQFRPQPEGQQAVMPFAMFRELGFRKYEVNVVVDNANRQGAPVVTEFNPIFGNLLGRIEKESQFGALVTDFTLIRGGSLHQANGGFLVIHAEDLLRAPFSWDGLKRALSNREIALEEPGERLGFIVTKSLNPDPIPLDVKVVVIGSPLLYHLFYSLDEDFKELFKVKADFDTRMDRDKCNVTDYIASLWAICCKEKLSPFDAEAAAKMVEYSSRLAADQEKLSTHFADMADIMREAHFWATQDNSSMVKANHVVKAIEEKIYRSNLIQERINQMIAEGTIKIDTTERVVGQVNGLSVISLGDFTFGRPSRITASIALGREGVTDIEREVRLGGPIHSKGVLILGGYLADQFAQDKPLTLSCRLVFEQSYEGVEGDSASSTELYAILSRLAGLPVKQGLAVTGSVNQKGEVQAIGGVNEKIEGFFAVCQAKGLTGEQGVIIPSANVRNLMLKEEVVEAVQGGQFHIYPVSTVDEGIEMLTGVPAGVQREDGTFQEGTVNYLVDQRLREIARKLRDFGREEEVRKEKKEEDEAKEPPK